MKHSRFCAYCGATGEMTADHVPPKALFPKPRPPLITVPACPACHAPTSADDEYFLQRLCLSEEGGEHPAAKQNVDAIMRSLGRPEAPGLRGKLLKDTHTVRLMTPSGLYLGKSLAFHIDLERMFRVVSRTVRGLYFEETERRLENGYDVAVHSNETLTHQEPDLLAEFTRTILEPLASLPPRVIGDNVFIYRHGITKEDPNLSVWALTFYGKVSFVALTGPAVDPRIPKNRGAESEKTNG